jgi:hypothetical protein
MTNNKLVVQRRPLPFPHTSTESNWKLLRHELHILAERFTIGFDGKNKSTLGAFV